MQRVEHRVCGTRKEGGGEMHIDSDTDFDIKTDFDADARPTESNMTFTLILS